MINKIKELFAKKYPLLGREVKCEDIKIGELVCVSDDYTIAVFLKTKRNEYTIINSNKLDAFNRSTYEDISIKTYIPSTHLLDVIYGKI